MANRFPTRLSAVPPQPPPDDPVTELQPIVDHYVLPAALELQRASHRADVDAIRTYGLVRFPPHPAEPPGTGRSRGDRI